MDFGAVVVELALGVFAIPEHACERGHAESKERFAFGIDGGDFIGLTQEGDDFDLDDGGLAGADVELQRGGATDAVENGEEMEFLVISLRLAEPPVREDRKFLWAIRFAGIQRQAAGGHAIALAFAKQPKI